MEKMCKNNMLNNIQKMKTDILKDIKHMPVRNPWPYSHWQVTVTVARDFQSGSSTFYGCIGLGSQGTRKARATRFSQHNKLLRADSSCIPCWLPAFFLPRPTCLLRWYRASSPFWFSNKVPASMTWLTICSSAIELPFSSAKQANSLLDDLEDVNPIDWDAKCHELKDKHKLERASNDSVVRWKAWLVDHWPNKSGRAPILEHPVNGQVHSAWQLSCSDHPGLMLPKLATQVPSALSNTIEPVQPSNLIWFIA